MGDTLISESGNSDANPAEGITDLNMVTGVQISYYIVCRTKLWLFSHRMDMEQENENVLIGRELDRYNYKRSRRNLSIGPGKLDFVRVKDVLEVHDIKKSDSLSESHRLQIQYYLYLLARSGVKAVGFIDYPQTNRHERVELSAESQSKIEQIIKQVREIISGVIPAPVRKPYCRKCAYQEFCWGGEFDNES